MNLWEEKYDATFRAYTGRVPTPEEQAAILDELPSVYALGCRLALGPDFADSPMYRKHAPDLIAYVESRLGRPPKMEIVAKIIAENWDLVTIDVWVLSESDKNSPEYQEKARKFLELFERLVPPNDRKH